MAKQERTPDPGSSFLDPSLAILKRALLSRAEALSARAARDTDNISICVHREMAQELRSIAEELHHW